MDNRNGGEMVQGSNGFYKTQVGDGDAKLRWGPNRPVSPEDQIRKVVMYAMIRANEMFRSERGLNECYLILPRSDKKLPDTMYVRRSVVAREADRAFKIERPFRGVDMRGMSPEEVTALGRFPKADRENPSDPTEALVAAIAKRHGVQIAERQVLDLTPTPKFVPQTPPVRRNGGLVAEPKRPAKVIDMASALLNDSNDSLEDPSSIFSVALKVEQRLAMHFASGSNPDRCTVTFDIEQGKIEFKVSPLDDSSSPNWVNGKGELAIVASRGDLSSQECRDALKSNIVRALEVAFVNPASRQSSVKVAGTAVVGDIAVAAAPSR